MYAAALDHSSKKYTTYELMISCCPIGSDPVCCLYLPRTGTDPCLFITLPLAGGHAPGRWLTTCTADRRKPAETWVITDQAHPVTTAGSSRVLLLDTQQHLEEQLTDALPKDPQQAQAAFQQLLQSPKGRRLQVELVKAQQDVADAWSLGVEKIPAVVVDRQYVVYGEPDISALSS
ncbi:TIGR03757 family integrating conjugative element protein [Pseudomonas aeruginosa]|nr:TIGR03757 family integrating conjugative element protein [Pseudomonas aeruginosa]